MWTQIRDSFEQSMGRIAAAIGAFLPGLIVFVAVAILSLVLAWLTRVTLQRLLVGARLDDLVHRWGFGSSADWPDSARPSLLIARVAFWLVLCAGFLLGLTVFDAAATSELAYRVLGYLPQVIAAGVIFVVGLFVARFLARTVLVSAVNLQLESARLLSLGVKWLVLVLATAMSLEHLGVGGVIVTLSFAILFGGIVLALALAVGLGSRELVSRSLEKRLSPEEHRAEPRDTVDHL